jgi:hypothetical protein
MAPSAKIRSLRRSTPGCRLIAYVDLSARLVLYADSDEPVPQESLDALCLRGTRLLGGPVADAAMQALAAASPPREALLFRNGAIEAFVRASGGGDEALCCVLSPVVALDPFLDAIGAEIDRLAAADDARAAQVPERNP